MKKYLYLEYKNNKKYLYLLKNPTNVIQNNLTNRYLISPIFPAIQNNDDNPNLSQKIYIGFYIYDKAYNIIGELLSTLDSSDKKKIWISHGLASIIVFSHSKDLLINIKKINKTKLRAYEIWEINNHKLNNNDIHYEIFKKSNINIDDYKIINFSKLPNDIQNIIFEFINSRNNAISYAAKYMVNHLSVYKTLTKCVNDIIDELNNLYNINNIQSSSTIYEKDLLDLENKKHQRVSRLIQINSALSYVISQSYSGAIPLLKNECFIRCYSLLGVGTAISAINRFAQFIEEIFEKNPIDVIISDRFIQIDGVNPIKSLGHYNPKEWLEYKLKPDTSLKNIIPEQYVHKLLYFSGRYGFREAEFSVSIALQVLFSTYRTKWNLMTLSHEMLHGHVREIMSAIFESKNKQTYDEAWKEYYKQYITFIKRKSTIRINMLDSLRFIIFNHLRYTEKFGSLSKIYPNNINIDEHINDINRGKLKLPSEKKMKTLLQDEYRNINEIIVHVLDYYYFYNENCELYMSLIWESWSTVPKVITNIYQYILRSLVTIGSNQAGSIQNRFLLSLGIVTEQLNKISEISLNNVLVNKGINLLKEKDFKLKLKTAFYSSILIADMARAFLRYPKIQSDLYALDTNIDIVDNCYRYLLKKGEFTSFQIKNPIIFILDMLNRRIIDNEEEQDDEWISCWIFLALSSSLSINGCDKDVEG